MQEGKSIIKFRYGGPPMEVNKTIEKTATNKNGKNGAVSTERCITYKIGNRFLSLHIIEVGCDGRINCVFLSLHEENGRGSNVNLMVNFVKDETYGVLYKICSEVTGSYNSTKENYSVPYLPDSEWVYYNCNETGSGGCFTVEKKKEAMGICVQKVKVTHDFFIDGELSYNVSIKIRNERGVGFIVEVEDPVKHTVDLTKRLTSKITRKMDDLMKDTMFSHFKHSMKLSNDGYNTGDDDKGDKSRSYKLEARSKIPPDPRKK